MMTRVVRLLTDLTSPRVSTLLKRRWRRLEDRVALELEADIRRFGGEDALPPGDDANALTTLARGYDAVRLEMFRTIVVPWLDALRPIDGARVLEIGSGSGVAAVAMGEQGAILWGVDADREGVRIAERRCHAYGLRADFRVANAVFLGELFPAAQFDVVVFFASLEHMTHAERIPAMRAAWSLLAPGGLWVVIEAPNRLWHHDNHTAQLPFFHWLPDELAFDYMRFSPRPPLNTMFKVRTEEAMQTFLRYGRGVSYHEFDLAFGSSAELDVVSSIADHRRRSSLLGGWHVAKQLGLAYRFESLLARLGPRLHPGFFEPYLNLAIRKP